MRRCALMSVVFQLSDVLIEGAVACISLYIFLVHRYIMAAVVVYVLGLSFDVCKCDISMCFDGTM